MEKDTENTEKFEGIKSRLLQTNNQKLHGAAAISDATEIKEIQAGKLSKKEQLERNGKGKEILVGQESKRANATPTDQMSSEEEVVDNELESKKSKSKWKRWKSQVRDMNKKSSNKTGPLSSKSLSSEMIWASLEKKKPKQQVQ